MQLPENNTHKIILYVIGISVLIMGIVLLFIPPALFPDPSMGFQVLRCMQLGGPFNTFVAPDQSDIAQNYTEFLTWWSPGQYLVPYFFKSIAGLNTGHAVGITVTIAQLCGLAGFYAFFKKIGFTPLVSVLSLVFIICQQAFMVPYVYYNGGEVLLFAFEGWFLYGCISLDRANIKLVLFVLLSAWIGFFLKSSFVWVYAAGLCCLWIRLSTNTLFKGTWIKKGLWIGIPAAMALTVIYVLFLSKGQSPVSATSGLKIAAETFSFPLASPLLSGFSIDDMLHGLLFHTGSAFFNPTWSIIIVLILAVLSMALMFFIVRHVPNDHYKSFIIVFYAMAFLFFSYSYLHQLTISYEARHFRLLGLLIVPGMIYLLVNAKPLFRYSFVLVTLVIGFVSFNYLIKGYSINNRMTAKGITGVSQPNIDQQSLNAILKLDQQNTNATFVFISVDIGLEIQHNHIITLSPIGDNLKINMDDYQYDGFAGPLYIVLPESYNGPKEKMVMKSFPGYAGWNVSMLSDKYVLYEAKMKRGK